MRWRLSGIVLGILVLAGLAWRISHGDAPLCDAPTQAAWQWLQPTAFGRIYLQFSYAMDWAGRLLGSAALMLLIGWRWKRWAGAIALAGGWASVGLFKIMMDRPRPVLIHWVETHGSAFPSGHAMSLTLVIGCIALYSAPRKPQLTYMLAALAIVLAAFSRVALGVHYPSDVVGGITLGLIWLGLCHRPMPPTLFVGRS